MNHSIFTLSKTYERGVELDAYHNFCVPDGITDSAVALMRELSPDGVAPVWDDFAKNIVRSIMMMRHRTANDSVIHGVYHITTGDDEFPREDMERLVAYADDKQIERITKEKI